MLEKLYLVNLSLIITHEIDSAYWNEWEMFNLPGGIQFFNIINFLLILILLYGFGLVVKKEKGGFRFSLILSTVGILAFIIHGTFILTGYQQFMLPVSLIILILCLIMSVWLFVSTMQNKMIFVKER